MEISTSIFFPIEVNIGPAIDNYNVIASQEPSEENENNYNVIASQEPSEENEKDEALSRPMNKKKIEHVTTNDDFCLDEKEENNDDLKRKQVDGLEVITGRFNASSSLFSSDCSCDAITILVVKSPPKFDYQTMSMDNKLLMEIESIGLSRELMVGALFFNTLVGSGHGSKQPNAVQKVDDDIDGLISDLENKYHEQVSRKTSVLDKLLKTTTEAKALQEKESKQDSVDKYTVLAYQKYMSASTKLAKKQALATVKQTLERCHEFETTGKSIFTDNESSPIMNLVNIVLN
nr:hypothetical protein [Tanacetum cinerariifolium]